MPRTLISILSALAIAGSQSSFAQTPAAARTSEPLRVEEKADGYALIGNGFRMLLSRSGSIEGISAGTEPVIDRAYLEVRDKTWHVKLSPRPDQVEVTGPRHVPDGESFRFAAKLADEKTGIQLGVDESVLVMPTGTIRIRLTFNPKASFTAQRISWNIEFPLEKYQGTGYHWADLHQLDQKATLPQQMAPDPHMLRNFEWLRLTPPSGPIRLQFETITPAKAPVDNVLEDLRFWNDPRFWVADAAPYPRPDANLDSPEEVAAGDIRAIQITIDLRPPAG